MNRAHGVDLLLVNPGSRTENYQALGSSLAAVEPPIWAGLIATFIRGRGFSVSILDANAMDLGPDEVADRISELSPTLTAVVVYGHNPSASTQVMPAAGAICASAKRTRPDLGILLVGGHVAALPERTLREEAADYVCGGEGPHAIAMLLRELSAGSAGDIRNAGGIWYREGTEIRSTPQAPLVGDLDREMPGVAWDLLPMGAYRSHNWHCFGEPSRIPYAAIYTSLGCPYHCTFCCIQAPFRSGGTGDGTGKGVNTYRMWKPETVMRQIDTLVRDYGVRHMKIADELFVLNAGHVDGLCDLIIERGYDLNIWAYARVDTIREEMLEKMGRAGIRWLAIGIESANDRVRADAEKGYPRDRLRKTIESVKDAGINVIGNFIFGLPEDDLSTMQETLDLAIALNCEFVNFNCAMAYPGSRLYETALESKWVLPSGWSGYSQYASNTVPLPTRHLSGADVLRFRDRAFRSYFTNPAYQGSILRKFGEATLSHVRDMVRHDIDREILR